MKRRTFLKTSAAAGLATILSNAKSVTATPVNDRINLATFGCGDRAGLVDGPLSEREDVRFLYVVDPFTNKAANIAKMVQKPDCETKVLANGTQVFDDKDVDAVVLVTPDHWHALHTIMACQAGKDVYVEKPVCRTPFEGEMMIKAARKYKRVVQAGNQSRSANYCDTAKQYILDGKLGDVDFVRVYNILERTGPHSINQGEKCPDGLDWDYWNGPAPQLPYSSTWITNWKWFWEFGTGQLGRSAIHQIDLARWLISAEFPKSVYSIGHFDRGEGGRTIPDTQSTVIEFEKCIMNIDQTISKPYYLEADWEVRENDLFPYWPQDATHVELYGTKGLMKIARLGAGWQVFTRTKNRQPQVVAQEFGRYPNKTHLYNFLDCIRSRQDPNANIEDAHRSTLLVHYANIAWRLGGIKLDIDPTTGAIQNQPGAAELWRPEFRKPYDIPVID